jgi:hypothetical protein
MLLAARHLRSMIETDQDMEKTLVACRLDELERYASA